MALPTASDNVFPKVILSEGAAPATPATGQVKMYAKADGLLYSKDDAGVETPLSGGGGGGGLTHAYVGTNAVGASWETLTNLRMHFKSFTLASAGFLGAISAYLRTSTDADTAVYCGVWNDSAGNPGILVGYNGAVQRNDLILSHQAGVGAGRWLHMPMGIYLPAGTYWIGVMKSSSIGNLDIAYDAGSDKYITFAGDYLVDATHTALTVTTSARLYSIRASILS